MKNIKIFNNHEEYSEYVMPESDKPNISLCEEDQHTHLNNI